MIARRRRSTKIHFHQNDSTFAINKKFRKDHFSIYNSQMVLGYIEFSVHNNQAIFIAEYHLHFEELNKITAFMRALKSGNQEEIDSYLKK